jgi:hypothetical protein
MQTLIFDWAYEEYLRGAFDPKLTMFRLDKEKQPTAFLKDRGRFPDPGIGARSKFIPVPELCDQLSHPGLPTSARREFPPQTAT